MIVTGDSTADQDLVNRLQQAGLSARVERTDDEAASAIQVRDGQGPDAPYAYGGGYGSIMWLSQHLGGLSLLAWPQGNIQTDSSEVAEPFSFVVRAASTGLPSRRLASRRSVGARRSSQDLSHAVWVHDRIGKLRSGRQSPVAREGRCWQPSAWLAKGWFEFRTQLRSCSLLPSCSSPMGIEPLMKLSIQLTVRLPLIGFDCKLSA